MEWIRGEPVESGFYWIRRPGTEDAVYWYTNDDHMLRGPSGARLAPELVPDMMHKGPLTPDMDEPKFKYRHNYGWHSGHPPVMGEYYWIAKNTGDHRKATLVYYNSVSGLVDTVTGTTISRSEMVNNYDWAEVVPPPPAYDRLDDKIVRYLADQIGQIGKPEFYVVSSDQRTLASTVRHDSAGAAMREAQRLARTDDKKFYVLAAIGCAEPQEPPIVTRWFVWG